MQAPLSSSVVRSAAALAIMVIGLTIGFGVGLGRAAPAPGDTPATTAPAATTTAPPTTAAPPTTTAPTTTTAAPPTVTTTAPATTTTAAPTTTTVPTTTTAPVTTTTTATPTTTTAAAAAAPTAQAAPRLDLSIVSSGQDTVSIAWTTSRGADGPYTVSLDGRRVGTTADHRFDFTGLDCGTTHQAAVADTSSRAQDSIAIATKPCLPTSLVRSLDGTGNNRRHADWGQAGTQYARVASTHYADGIAAMAGGPPPRRVSNRIFNDLGQNIFSENGISQWGWAWGQFLDHDMDLRDETPGEAAPIPFDRRDPLERFTNDVGQMAFSRSPAAPGTGTGPSSPRQQINTISSFIDASQVYGATKTRLDWLTADNGFDLLLPGGYLPKVTARGDASTAPPMDLMAQLAGNPTDAVVAGDVRANENLALTAIQTLFAREHNRIADSLPAPLAPAIRFQIARRVVGAEIEWITYTQFLPALGVQLSPYHGYDPDVNPSITNEFATVGFRAHSMVHGEFEPTVHAGTYSNSQLQAFRSAGIEVETNADGTLTLVIPLAVAFGNPDLVQQAGLGPALQSLGEREYNNDEQIDDSLRSTLFKVPKPGIPDPSVCGEPVVNPDCFSDVEDLGADDIQRGRDHGIPSYNDLRQAYGLPRVRSFTDITGESTDRLPRRLSCDDPGILQFVSLADDDGNPVPVGDPDNATSGVRASTLAARLRCVYGSVDSLDAFVGMVAERHVAGTEFGPLQLAIWKRQFTALRDGDSFFYANDDALAGIKRAFGIDYQVSLGTIIRLNSGEAVADDVFKAAD